ncbi:MAG: LamG domain-containing protein, partial [Phycisphaerae bacterium]
MCRKLFLLTSFVLVFVFAFCTTAMASDIAFYVGQWNTDGWYDESQFEHVETIIAETGHLFKDIQQFDDTQFDAFGAWVDERTNDGKMDIIWLNGCTPSVLYPNPNEQPDGSRAEEWLDGGNMIINVGDWFAYCTYEGGPRGGEGRGGDNGPSGAANILDLSSGIIVGADGSQAIVTPTGKEYLPSLNDPAKTDRPVILAEVQAPWEVAAIFASGGGTEDPAVETGADPVVIHNTETGGYVAFINQASGGPDGWIADRGLTSAEFIGNWVNNVVGLSAIELPDLLAWWTCDEGAGTVVGDSSGNGNDGTFVNGDPAWVEGIHGNAVQLVGPTLIEVPPLNVELTEATMAGWIKPNGAQPDWSSIIMTRNPGLATGFNVLGFQLAYHWNDTSDSWSFRGGDMIAEDDWTFAAVTIEPDKATFYVNGVAGSVNEISHGPCIWNSNIYLGGDGNENWIARRMNGALDDVSLFSRALTANEILAAMEGIAPSPTIIWVSDFYDDDGDGITDDIGWVELLEAQGYNVDYTMGAAVGDGYWRTLDDDKIAALNAADLIIVSRCSDSGNYDDGDEVAQWNSVTTPIMLQAMHIVRNTRWRWLDTESLPNISDAVVEILAPDNPIFAGVASPVQVGDGLVGPTTYVDITGVGVGNGTLLAQLADTEVAWIIEWEAGVEFYPGSGEIAGGPRMVFAAGTQDEAGVTGRGMYNLTPEGAKIFLNAVNMMLPAVDVTTTWDMIQGVPNDGVTDWSGDFGWPPNETPDLAIDDDITTKYLHFKGEIETTGFQVTPIAGPTIVTG